MPGRTTRVLVEREPERSALQALLGAAGGVTVIEADAGVGKSALLQDAADGTHGRRVLTATGHELEQQLALGVIVQLLSPAVAKLTDGARQALFAGAAALAEPLFGGGPTDALPAGIEHGLQWVVAGLSAEHPLALLVDDAHLADEASLRALIYLARRATELELALIVAGRPVDRGPTADLLRQLRTLPGAQRLTPGPLTRAGVAHIVAEAGLAGAAPAFVDACAESTAGNPLYLRELLLVVSARGIPPTAEGAPMVREVGPVAVAEAVFLTLDRLDPGATDLVSAIATLGDGCRIADAATLAGLPTARATRLAGQLQRDGLLAPGDAPRFVHPVVGNAIASELTDLERDHAHAAAAAVLAAAHAPDHLIAEHLLRCSPQGSAAFAAHLQAAAASATARGDAATATRLLERALDEEDSEQLRTALALAAGRAGAADAEERFAAALAVTDGATQRAALHLALGRMLLQRGRYADAAATFERGSAEVQPGGPHHEELRAGWASAAMWLPDAGGKVYAQAQETVLAIERPSAAGEHIALTQLAARLLLTGRQRDTALTLARRAWDGGRMVERLGAGDATAFTTCAVLADGDAIDEALAVIDAIAAAAREAGLPLVAATASYVRGSFLMLTGDLPGGAAAAEEAIAAEAVGWGQYASAARWVAAGIARRRGDLAAAQALLELTPAREQELAQGNDYAVLPLARGELALAQGDPARAVTLLEETARRGAALGVCIGRYNWRPSLVIARRAAGDHAGAATLARENLGLAREWGSPQALGAALRAQAAAEPERATALLEEAADAVAQSTDRSEQLRVCLARGLQLAAVGDRGARDVLAAALDLADRSGATVAAERARRALRDIGARPRRARTTGADALTPGELRVARLAAGGLTNREIAEQLFVTPKAVKWHLGNAYRKLGVSGRDELPGALGT